MERCGGKNPLPWRILRRYPVEAVQDAAAAWEESGGARKSAAAEDLAMPLRDTVDQDAAAAWKEGEQDAAVAPPGRRKTRGTRATKSTAAEELAPVLGKIAEKL